MNGDKKYHAEVKITIEGHEARVNCFEDTLNEIFGDIGTICAQFPPDWKNPALREAMNQENIDKARRTGKPAPKPEAGADQPSREETGEIPVCEDCGTDEFMELIGFTDKKTGKPRQAWKCQQCQKWVWPDKNGRGR